jgi:hypothetical protein
MEHGMKCTNPQCSTDQIVDDLIECPDCGENKVMVAEWGNKKMENEDKREYTVTIMDGNDKPDATHWRTGEEDLVRYIRECCERYGMENSDPDPDEPFTVIIKRIPKSDKFDFEKILVNSIFGPE